MRLLFKEVTSEVGFKVNLKQLKVKCGIVLISYCRIH